MSSEKSPIGNVKTRSVKCKKTDARPQREIDLVNKNVRLTYLSTSQIARHFQEEPVLKEWLSQYVRTGDNDWMPAGFTAERAIECATLGISDNIELIKAERHRAEKLDVQVCFPSWQADVAGAFADVAAFIAGDPMSMRRLVNQVSDTRPIRIFVGMASSCSFTSEQLAKRGALVSALALQLSKTRSVDVYAVNSGRKTFSKGSLSGQSFDWSVMVRLPKPVSASDLSYWLCHQASVRGLLYACERAFSGTLSWPAGLGSFSNYASPEGIAAHAKLWGAGESDVVVPFPMAENAAEAEMIAKPETWLRNTLQRVNAIASES
jgi:hypothetical protein